LSCYVTICLQRPPRGRMCLSNSGNVIENEKTRSILPVGNRDPGRIFTNFSMTYQSRSKLPIVHDTSQLPALCYPVDTADLRPGDLLNIPRGHVLLCAGWARPDRSWIYYYETGGGPDYWKPGLKESPLTALLDLGYQSLRYRGMAYERKTSGKEVLTRSAINRATSVTQPTIGEP
jgi:hypothetical protein